MSLSLSLVVRIREEEEGEGEETQSGVPSLPVLHSEELHFPKHARVLAHRLGQNVHRSDGHV